MAHPNPGPFLKDILYTLNHVFLPPKLPQEDDALASHDVALCRFVYHASCRFTNFLSQPQQQQWSIVSQMLKTLLETTQALDKDVLVKNILFLEDGEVLVLHIRAQNAGLILRRLRDTMIFEAFEVSAPPEAVMKVKGKLICSYPGPAVEVPLDVAHDPSFVEQLVSFLVHMDVDQLDAQATTTKAQSKVPETRGTTHPRYITQLLIMTLCGMGKEAVVKRITKRIADDVCWENARNPWRRSPLWLVLRVAIQTTADSRDTYKAFMVFFQAELLRLFLDHDLSSELLHVARVKTSRRVYKLGTSASPRLLEVVQVIGREIEERLQARWSEEQRLQVYSPTYTPDPSAFETDTTISLLESRAYLTKVMCPDPYTQTSTAFNPRLFPRLRDISDFRDLFRNGLTNATQADCYVALTDFEFLVQERLDGWVTENIRDTSACETLGSCLEQYISVAIPQYSSNPEAQSLMLLTIMELWVALDTIAVVQCPLLSLYSPEIPSSVLNPLLLRRSKSIERAARIECYLRRRHSDATCTTSIYSDQFDDTTFAVRYFQGSPSLQAVKASIERAAADARETKRTELRQKNANHKSLTEEIARLSCKYSNKSSKHSHLCSKCKLQKKANKMRINVHEWTLPTCTPEAEAIVFELECPPVFAIWRTRTYQILRDIGMAHISVQSKFTPPVLLQGYEGLAAWSKKGTSDRITFGSETKSFSKSHYRNVRIPTVADGVCVNNGLRFRLYDSVKEERVISSFDLNLDSYCTLPLPEDGEGLYRHLQYAVTHTTHTHNETIVNQGDCPMKLSMHEQLAFSNLRCGSQLQWKNIVRELRANILTFSREEVHTLITQAAWQIGPLSKDGSIREWHFELGLSDFGLVLIREAMDLLFRIKANWMEGTTVKSIIYLTSRLLCSTADVQGQVRQNGYALLRKARDITHTWMREIAHKLQDAVDDNEISELQRHACEMAAICRATFDVDPGTHLDALLCSSADVAILIECAVVIHDNTPPHLGDRFPEFQRLLHRDRRLSHLLELPVIKLIDIDRCGLDTAIGSVWSGYRPGGGWEQLPEPNSRWLMSRTALLLGQTGRKAQEVHYNILDGGLLVDGKPLGRLPREIVGHATYKRIFGQKIFDVIPASMSGMDYMTRSPFYGYQVFFALRGSLQSLIIRAQTLTPSSQIFELIPHDMISADFPNLFVIEHAHWMDTSSGEVEFRPLDQLWKPSSQNWRLVFFPDGRPSRMVHGIEGIHSLIDIRSGTFNGIAARIRHFEYPEYLTIVYNTVDQSHPISIELPRFRLSFFLSEGELESKNMRGMVIDGNQCTGTMIGLGSQLVLRHKDPKFASLPHSRHVLIPHGDVCFTLSPDENHVRVHIDTRTHFMRQVTWHKYEIDSDLGLLVGNVNLTSRLYRIYLHALCSHPLADPLTSQTGADHALQELGTAGCFSFQRLTEADVKLLRLIESIAPCRQYYPEHLRVMQTTEWSPHLPALSQHGAFEPAVRSILQYAQSLAIFPELMDGGVELGNKHRGDFFLMARATRRNAIYYEGGLGVDIPLDCDQRYSSRDSPYDAEHNSHGIQALNTSRLVYAWPVGLTRHIESSELLEAFKGWNYMSGVIPNISLIYTEEWLGLELSQKWLTIYDLCRKIDQGISMKKFELVFSFSALTYSMPNLWESIRVLLAIATMHTSLFVDPPPHSSYDLADGFDPVWSRVRSIIVSGINNPAYDYDEGVPQCEIDDAADHLMKCTLPQSPFHQSNSCCRSFNAERIMSGITEYFASCSRNRDLRSFASQVTTVLQANYLAPPLADVHTPRFHFVPKFDVSHSQCDSPPNLANLLSGHTNSAPVHSSHTFGTGAPTTPRQPGQPIDTNNLENLISQFKRHSQSVLTQLYGERLEKSREELHGQQTLTLLELLPPIGACLAYRDQCQSRLRDVSFAIRCSLEPSTTTQRILANAGLWPRIHPRAMLHPLASASNTPVTQEWTKSLTTFAKAFIEYQFSQRLVMYALRSESDNFFKELDNASFGWSDERRNTDWLLIQIQGNFITRALQSDVAREMITPSSGCNTALQLNMGEGKSSVIVPFVAVALADSHKLVRIIVLESLAGQMFQLLVERISGLANRRIFYLPFSRDVKMDVQQIYHIRSLFEECARVRGVLVVQPKHILSFQLMVIDRTLSRGSRLKQVAQELQQVQTWLTSASRDILDESDELLHVRYQLIYTMDEQRPLDNGPDRWTITQNVFDLVRRHAKKLHEKYPKEVELLEQHMAETREGDFSHIRLLGTSAAQDVVSRIAEDVLNGRLENLTFAGLSARVPLRDAVLRFIKEYHVDDQTCAKVKDFYGGSCLWKGLLLLRGLLAHGILIYVLRQQRWRVDYGLDSKRSLLAVPYRAKDVPSLRSDFGHPDVAICLTCLSYYYGGLTHSQVRECFDLLFKLDNPTLEYENWVKRGGRDIPVSLRQLIGVNTKDVQTFTHDVVPIFRYNQATINFFLSQVVFPKEAKEFLFKLGTSGWDLAKRKANFTTGFSGTNDNSDLLPTSISQSDPVNQLRMNAQVLGYLLQPENDRYICTQRSGTDGQPCSVTEFLELLVREQKEIRVLLDVGAQMLEMTNKQLVKHWLELRQSPKDVAAGVFFDDADKLSVLTRDGVVEPLYSSPFSQRLHECIIYLDDAHTRGTDLKLPLKFRAMVTLGPKVTKDRLVQGCMRMRKLGQGQSVVFCAPPDIDRRIREAERIADTDPVKVVDVLSWVMSNSCTDIEHHIPHWVQQGIDYHKRQPADCAVFASEADAHILQNAWLQPAAQSLDDMYGLSTNCSFNTVKDISAMQERLCMLGVTTVRDVRMEEEQEREVSHEVEQEQQIERPPKVPPAVHHLDEEVRSFVQQGTICINSNTFFPLITPLRSEFDALSSWNSWSRQRQVLCTRDFMTTTKGEKEKSDITSYLRPVNWIVSHTLQDGSLIFVVMSPYEINLLLQDIRASKYVHLHMYAPRTTQAMKPLDDLTFYCIPPLPSKNASPSLDVRCQLNIWAGQLYVDSYETYLHLCLLLGVSSSEEAGYSSVESDRFVPKRGRIGEMVDVCLFEESPLALLKTLFGLRRKGMSYQQTHTGKILHARLLSREDFEECSKKNENGSLEFSP